MIDTMVVMTNERNYGIDLLRIVSMIMIPVLHILGQGAILDCAIPFSTNYNVSWLMETACYCAVNVYGIISGYVGYGKKHSISRFLELYMQVLFYTLPGLMGIAIYKPELVTVDALFETFFPFASLRASIYSFDVENSVPLRNFTGCVFGSLKSKV